MKEKQEEQRSAETTIQMLECGDLALKQEIQYGILMIGNTKAGKTTSGHFLAQQHLQGIKGDTGAIYECRETKFKRALIGRFESVSETEIPNFFYPEQKDIRVQVREKGQKKLVSPVLIDCPGYGDTYGCHRIVSNSYFNYRTYSKVQNIKYIIVVEWTSMKGVAKDFSFTLNQFFSSFVDFDKQLDKIIASTCLMITKVPREKELKDVMDFFQINFRPRGFHNQVRPLYEKLKNDIIQKKKIFVFHQAQVDRPCRQQSFLSEINSKTKYWCRLNKNQKIDMSCIRISANNIIKEKIDDNQDGFAQDWQELTQYYKGQIKDPFIKDLQKYLTALIDDAFCQPDTKQKVLKVAKQTVDRLEKINRNDLYRFYEPQRREAREKLVRREQGSRDVSGDNKPFWLRKIEIAEQIEELSNDIDRSQDMIHQFDSLPQIIEDFSNKFMTIVKSIYHLFSNSQYTVKMTYYLNNMLEMGQVFLKLTIPKTQNENHFPLFVAQYPHDIFQLLQWTITQSIASLKLKYCQRIDFSQMDIKMQEQKYVHNFLESMESMEGKKNLSDSMLNHDEQSQKKRIKKQKIQLKINSEEQSIKNCRDIVQRKKIIKNILAIRQQIENYVDDTRLKFQKDDNFVALFMRITNLLGNALLPCDQEYTQAALECFRSIHNGHQIIKYYKNTLEKKRNSNIKNKGLQQFLFQFMKQAAFFERRQLAIELAQQAFHISQQRGDYTKIQEAVEFISEVAEKPIEKPTYLREILSANMEYKPIKKKIYDKICRGVGFEP